MTSGFGSQTGSSQTEKRGFALSGRDLRESRCKNGVVFIVPLKWIEHGFVYMVIRSLYTPYFPETLNLNRQTPINPKPLKGDCRVRGFSRA